ncbi:MAG TPA: VIT domain-containing protein [Acidimicrobiia bacterium]|nr:VIT domain-containing protein [Acidimicrobiia bacterium]
MPIDPPLPPCPWWDCRGEANVVVEEYRVDVAIDDGIALTRVRQVLRNDSDFVAEGEFLHPVPADAAVTGLTLWIDGEPVDGELLDGDAARRAYEDIVRRTLDPALLEYAGDGLLRLRVFPIEARGTRTVEISYRQVLPADTGLARYRHPLGREHNAVVESVEAHITISAGSSIKSVYSPTHDVGIDRVTDRRVDVGYEGSGPEERDFVLYYATDTLSIGVDLLTYAEDGDGWFLLLASPGLAAAETVVPKDVVVVLDVSGSMEGEKIEQARDAARYVIDHLNPDDRFDVIAFSTGADSFGDGLRPASSAGDAADWVAGLAAGGSTNIDRALEVAFDRASPSRPTYVVFLTDGLATEGVIDTAEILDNLELRAAETVSVFAFGVGYDVDTLLLDAIARNHHGSATYVTPDEAIDAAVEALYAKVASPVLTGVTLEIDGVTVSDLHPTPLPDVFRGGQLVVAGRYEGSGPATVHLSGRVRGETVRLTFDDLSFGAGGGNSAVPRIWAARKIGHLLTTLRLEGPDEETIDQIVRLSIRWGIVTPYTSFLVADDSPFGEEALRALSASAYREAATTPPAAPSGEAAVGAADAAGDLAGTEGGFVPDHRYADAVRLGGGATFRLTAGRWVDTRFDPSMEQIKVAYGSEDYFALAASDPGLSSAFAVGAAVTVVWGDIAFQVVGPDEIVAQIPVTTTTTTVPTTDPPGTTVAPDTTPSDNSGIVVLLGLAAFVGAVITIIMKGRKSAVRN